MKIDWHECRNMNRKIKIIGRMRRPYAMLLRPLEYGFGWFRRLVALSCIWGELRSQFLLLFDGSVLRTATKQGNSFGMKSFQSFPNMKYDIKSSEAAFEPKKTKHDYLRLELGVS